MKNNVSMKTITFKQLQLRLLLFLFVLFTSAVFSYRHFIELPHLKQSISKLSERELDTLTYGIKSKLDLLFRVNFDYAVWTSTYEFIRTLDQEYIEENTVDNTFFSLGIDGIFYLDENLKPIFTKGFHHTKRIDLKFSFYEFDKYPVNAMIFPEPIISNGAPNKLGFINTQHGPAMFSTTQIRDSHMNGENRGYLVMIQLLEKPFTTDLSRITLTEINYQSPINNIPDSDLISWGVKPEQITISPFSYIVLEDAKGKAVSILKMKHAIGKIPNLINQQSVFFTALISVLIYLVYLVLVMTIIDPVKKLAKEIKEREGIQKFCPLNESFIVAELALVSQNVNKLMLTVQEQNKILSEQANTDPLTKILNRRGLINALEIHKKLCIRNNITFTVVMVDIDHFKAYNDALGHIQGDVALSSVANVLNQECHRSTDICARYGGEEFMLLLTGISSEDLDKKLNHIIHKMQQLAIPHPDSPTADYITVSMGAVTIKPTEIVDFDIALSAVFKIADNAMYQAKHSGRNCFVVRE